MKGHINIKRPDHPLTEDESKKESLKWNVPNWRVAFEYNYANDLSVTQLRWEFLRREFKYRNFWNHAQARGKTISGYAMNEIMAPDIRADTLSPDFQFNDETLRGGPIALTPPNLKRMLDVPYERQDDYLDKWYGRQIRELIDSGYVLLSFDLKHGLPTQTNRARKILENIVEIEKEENPDSIFMERPSKPKDPCTLLRVLDADNEGVDLIEIGQRIYGVEDENDAKLIAKGRLRSARLCRLKL